MTFNHKKSGDPGIDPPTRHRAVPGPGPGDTGTVETPPPTGTGSINTQPDGQRRPFSQAQRLTITTRAAGQRLPAIWGSNVRTGGIVCYENISNGAFITVIAVCHGPIGAMTFTVDGVDIAQYGFTNGSVGGTGGYEIFLGTKSQAVSTILSSRIPAWTSSLPGIAYVVIAYVPQGKAPNYQSFQATITQGLLVRDPRSGVDGNGIPNTARAFSDNPALIWADARTSRRYGVGDPDSSIDWTGDATTAANDCDHDIGGGVKRFVMGYKCDNASVLNPEAVTQEICKHAAMNEARYNGKWHVWVDKAQSASGLSFTDAGASQNIVDANFREKGQSEIFNRVRVHYVDSANNYVDASAEDSDPAVDAGTKEDVLAEYTVGVPAAQALRLAQQYRRRSQKQREYFLTAGPEGTKLTPGLRFSATSSQWGNAVTKDLICTSVQCVGSIWQVRAEEYDAAVYPA